MYKMGAETAALVDLAATAPIVTPAPAASSRASSRAGSSRAGSSRAGSSRASSAGSLKPGAAANKLRRAVDAARRGSTDKTKSSGGAEKTKAKASGADNTKKSAAAKFQQAAKDALAAAPSAEKPTKKYGQSAYDLKGNEYDLTELRDRRNAAVSKGLRKMYKFFKKDNYAALHEIGDDAPSIFFECWYTSAHSGIRMEAKAMCKKLLPEYERQLLHECGYVPPPPTAIELAQQAQAERAAAAAARLGAEGGGSTSIASLGQQVVRQRRNTNGGTRLRLTQVIADANANGSTTTAAVKTAAGGGAPSRSRVNSVEVVEVADGAGGGKEEEEGDDDAKLAAKARREYAARKAAEDAEEEAVDLGEEEEDEEDEKASKKPKKALKKVAGGGGGSGSSSAAGGAGGGRKKKEKERPNRPDRDDFFAIMFLARCKHEMGDEVDALLERADVAWRTHHFESTDNLFGYQKEGLLKVKVDDWLMLLMRIMIMEYNQILFTKRYRLQWGLKDALIALRQIELTPPPRGDEPFTDGFHHSFYLATHIVYVQSAYNAIKADQREIPWLYRYVRQSFRYWMRQVKEQKKDPDVYVDIDGIGEICDCLRGCGMTEGNDPMLCEGTLYMLNTQRKNGFWPAVLPGEKQKEKDMDFYHRVHPTWVCTQALRDRDFKIGAGANAFWPGFVAKVIKESNFTTLDYKPGW